MRMILLKPELRYGGVTYHAGDEIEAEEIGEVRSWFALGWVKKAELQTRAMTPEPVAPVVENPPWEEPPKSNIDPLTGKRRYRRRDMKAEE